MPDGTRTYESAWCSLGPMKDVQSGGATVLICCRKGMLGPRLYPGVMNTACSYVCEKGNLIKERSLLTLRNGTTEHLFNGKCSVVDRGYSRAASMAENGPRKCLICVKTVVLYHCIDAASVDYLCDSIKSTRGHLLGPKSWELMVPHPCPAALVLPVANQ